MALAEKIPIFQVHPMTEATNSRKGKNSF